VGGSSGISQPSIAVKGQFGVRRSVISGIFETLGHCLDICEEVISDLGDDDIIKLKMKLAVVLKMLSMEMEMRVFDGDLELEALDDYGELGLFHDERFQVRGEN